MTNRKILVTGGAGYIGSHTVVLLIEAGYEIVIFDNFCNSSREAIKRVEKIVDKKIITIKGDVRSREDLHKVFNAHKIDSVIHFAGLKAVGESVEQPLKYYDNNVNGTAVLCEVMTINLGTGKGYSVLDMVKAFEKASGKTVPYKIAPRRTGDIAKCFANPSYAKKILDWEAKKSIDEMCEDSWKWQSNNPNGYSSTP